MPRSWCRAIVSDKKNGNAIIRIKILKLYIQTVNQIIQTQMSVAHTIRCFLIISVALLTAGCSKDDEPKSRSFRMGFSVLPYGVSEDAMEYIYDRLSVDSDIVNHHFDNGVPWVEALAGEEFPQALQQDWNFRRAKMHPSQKTYVSVTPISYQHNGLAAYRGAEANMALPSPWNHYRFNDENVKTAYLNYCRRVIDFFKPDYFAMSIEANLLFKMRPDYWPQYLELHEYIFRHLKAEYPDLPIFSTIAGAPLVKGFLEDNDATMQRLAAMQLLEMSDYYAIAFYPPQTAFQDRPLPLASFEELFALSTKPIIIAETGFSAKSVSGPTGQGSYLVSPDPVKQKLFVDALLSASGKWKAEFVIWFMLRDMPDSPSSLTDVAWKDSGLYDEAGNPRPALNSWREWLRKRVVEN